MSPQLQNYFSNMIADVGAFLTAFAVLEDRFQEGFDREIDDALAGLDFSDTGDLNHLTPESVGDAFAAFVAVQTIMNASNRENWNRFLEVVRSWTR